MARAPRKPARSKRAPRGRARGLGVPKRGTGAAKIFTSSAVGLDFAAPVHRYRRADLEIHGIFHSEASYEGRIFFNNPKADDKTPKKDPCVGFEVDLGAILMNAACEVPNPKPEDKSVDTKGKLFATVPDKQSARPPSR